MKILQLTSLAGPGAVAGGVWQVVETQSRALAERGHEVRVLAGWLGVPTDTNLEIPVELVRVRRPFPRAGLRYLWSVDLLDRLRAAVDWADIVHIHLCRDFVTNAGVQIARRRGVRVVAQCHGMLGPAATLPKKTFDRFITAKTIEGVDRFLYLTDREARDLVTLNVPPPRTRRIFNASFRGRVSRQPDNLFCFISRLHPRKQPEVFIEAAIQRIRSGSRANFIVAGPDQGSLAIALALVRENGAADRFEMLGEVKQSEVPEILARCTANVLPSKDEPYPMIVIEAAAVGTPTILTTLSGVSGELAEAGAAHVVYPTVENVAESMRAFEESESYSRGLSERAREFYERNWTPDALGAALEEHYADVEK